MRMRAGAWVVLAALVATSSATEAALVTVDPTGPGLVQVTVLADQAAEPRKAGTGAAAGGKDVGKEVGGAFTKTGLSGPDMAMGFNDYLEFRAQVPAGFKGGLRVAWENDVEERFPEARQFVIPAEQVPRDGRPHVYRLDMGPEPLWTGNLKSLAIGPAEGGGGTGWNVSLVRVGDLDGEVYQDPTVPMKSDEKCILSKHFRFVWNQKRAEEGMNETKARGTLRNAEKNWQFYVKVLKYREPCVGPGPNVKHKVNFTCMAPGYFGGGGGLNIDPSGLGYNPPSWVVPHELMHVFQAAQGGGVNDWHEAHANFAREQWINWLWMYHAHASNLEAGGYLPMIHYSVPHGADYYICWPFFMYLEENPDNLQGLGYGLVARMWQQGKGNESVYQALNRVAPQLIIKDLVGKATRRMLTYANFKRGEAIRRNFGFGENMTVNQVGMSGDHPAIAELRVRPDDPAWWQVPLELAPQQGAFQVHEILPQPGNRTVSVTVRGLPVAGRKADWRPSFVAVTADWKERYVEIGWTDRNVPLKPVGTNTAAPARPAAAAVPAGNPVAAGTYTSTYTGSITLAPDEVKLFLVVAATPDDWMVAGFDDEACPYQSAPAKARFPYEVRITGGVPQDYFRLHTQAAEGKGHAHPNGGGLVADTAHVEGSVFVGPRARVLDYARVTGGARIEDEAVVSGHARVWGGAVIKDRAKVRDYAAVSDRGTVVSGSARVLEHAQVREKAQVKDCAVIKGNAIVVKTNDGAGEFGGDAVMDGDVQYGKTVTNGFQFGFMPWNMCLDKWINARHAPANLWVDYEFNAPHEALAKDEHGVTDGYLIGKPVIGPDKERDGGALELSGKDQYVLLQRSVLDLDQCTVALWVKPRLSPPELPLVFFGTDADHGVTLVARDKAGKPRLYIRNGGTIETLIATPALPEERWSHLAFTLDGTVATLYLNGAQVAQAKVAARPDAFLAPNTNTGKQQSYIGRGLAATPTFAGKVDGFKVYSKALDKGAIEAMMKGK